jgi:GTP-binding protein EngB required for normal cell division
MLKVQKSTNEINIILLGESGVGKSTFINALQNYFYHQTFEKAKNGQLKILLPAFFTITDENYNQIRVKIGNEDRNEQDATGKAATQSAKTHTIKMGSYLINIIDTPGIGDPEGFKKDKENFEETIQYISSYQKLNGICILLKPNNARLDLHFRYCFKELLVHLHRKAAPNIVFCFTNTRGYFNIFY